MPNLGIHTLALTPLWRPEDADRLLPPVTAQGATVVEVPLLDPPRFDSAGTRAAVERNEMELYCSLGLPSELDVVQDAETVVAFLDAALDAAARAGAGALSGVTYGTIGKTSGAPRTDVETDAICRLLERAAATARGLGLQLGIEPCNRYETHLMNTGADGAWFIERVGADNVFVHLDTYHMNIEEPGMAEGIRATGEHLGYIHLSESNRGVPGRGTIDWDATFTGLAEIGFDGPMTVESFVHVAPEIAAGLAIWRPVAERPEDVIEAGLPFLRQRATAAGLDLS